MCIQYHTILLLDISIVKHCVLHRPVKNGNRSITADLIIVFLRFIFSVGDESGDRRWWPGQLDTGRLSFTRNTVVITINIKELLYYNINPPPSLNTKVSRSTLDIEKI